MPPAHSCEHVSHGLSVMFRSYTFHLFYIHVAFQVVSCNRTVIRISIYTCSNRQWISDFYASWGLLCTFLSYKGRGSIIDFSWTLREVGGIMQIPVKMRGTWKIDCWTWSRNQEHHEKGFPFCLQTMCVWMRRYSSSHYFQNHGARFPLSQIHPRPRVQRLGQTLGALSQNLSTS